MANLTYREKLVLEELFGMSSGFIMDFSNSSFSRFVKDVINIDVYSDPGYEEYSSKANKLRKLWDEESDNVVGTLIEALLSHFEAIQLRQNRLTDYERKMTDEMRLVARRLKGNASHVELPNKQENSLQVLQEDISNALARNKPELVLDRLHTFSTKLLRKICDDNGIKTIDDKGTNLPLHSLAGMIRKKYEIESVFQSSFTLAAIQNSISLFEKYNDIRNKQSYAHDNDVLDTMEAEFAVRIMADLLTFIDKAETYRKNKLRQSSQLMTFDDELPF